MVAVDWHVYANVAIVAHTAKQLRAPNSATKSQSWGGALATYASLRKTIEASLRGAMPPNAFTVVQAKDVMFHDDNVIITKKKRIVTKHAPQMKCAHALLHFNAAEFIKAEYATKEALLYAVYESHRDTDKTAAVLKALYDGSLCKSPAQPE